MNEETLQKLSALVDGELDLSQDGRLLDTSLRDEQMRGAWARYHLISDAMRGELPGRVDTGFAARVNAAVAGEPTALAPGRRAAAVLKALAGMAIAASVALVAVVGVQRFGTQIPGAATSQVAVMTPATGQQLDTAPEPEVVQWQVPTETAMPASRSRLNSYLVNYSEQRAMMGGPGMLPYVKVVGYEREP